MANKKLDKDILKGVSGGVDLSGLAAFHYNLSDKGTAVTNRIDNARMTQYRIEAENKYGKDNFMEILDQTGNNVYYVSLKDVDELMKRLS